MYFSDATEIHSYQNSSPCPLKKLVSGTLEPCVHQIQPQDRSQAEQKWPCDLRQLEVVVATAIKTTFPHQHLPIPPRVNKTFSEKPENGLRRLSSGLSLLQADTIFLPMFKLKEESKKQVLSVYCLLQGFIMNANCLWKTFPPLHCLYTCLNLNLSHQLGNKIIWSV